MGTKKPSQTPTLSTFELIRAFSARMITEWSKLAVKLMELTGDMSYRQSVAVLKNRILYYREFLHDRTVEGLSGIDWEMADNSTVCFTWCSNDTIKSAMLALNHLAIPCLGADECFNFLKEQTYERSCRMKADCNELQGMLDDFKEFVEKVAPVIMGLPNIVEEERKKAENDLREGLEQLAKGC